MYIFCCLSLIEYFSDPNSIHRVPTQSRPGCPSLLDPNGFLLARAPIFGRHRQNPLVRGDSETRNIAIHTVIKGIRYQQRLKRLSNIKQETIVEQVEDSMKFYVFYHLSESIYISWWCI